MGDLTDWRMRQEGTGPLFMEWLKLAADAGMDEVLEKSDIELKATDALIIVDMQNDFIPVDSVNPHGGAFGVGEGAHIAEPIIALMKKFVSSEAMVVATRDYHPVDHVSFCTTGGPFPPHCIQGSVGSYMYEPIGKCFQKLKRRYPEKVQMVFKGIHEDIDSFGSFEYLDNEESLGRVTNRKSEERLHGCTTLCNWTGCVSLKCSNAHADVNAPPDVLAAHRRVTLAELLKKAGIKRIFACGLALDFCVLDTCLNGAHAGFEEVFLILDAARAAHLAGIGSVGSGFLHEHSWIKEKMAAKNVRFVPSVALAPDILLASARTLPTVEVGASFPAKLGPFGLVPVNGIEIKLDLEKRRYAAILPEGEDVKQVLEIHGLKPEGPFSPPSALTLPPEDRASIGIPEHAVSFLWANPVDGIIDTMDDQKRGYLCTTSAPAAFLAQGGFIYLDAGNNAVLQAALTLGSGLTFHGPEAFRKGYATSEKLKDRWQPVTMNSLREKGAVRFAWVNPGEVLEAIGGEPWKVSEHGAFAYVFNEDLAEHDTRNIFFAVSGLSPNGVDSAAVGKLDRLASNWSTQSQASQLTVDEEKTEVPPAKKESRACSLQ